MEWMAGRLLVASLQGVIVIGLVWLACRRFPRMPASVQAALWWLAALKMVLVLLPLPAIPLPLLLAPSVVEGPPVDLAVLDLVQRLAPSGVEGPSDPSTTGSWIALVVVLWIAGVFVQAIRLLADFRRLRRVIDRAQPLREAEAAVVAEAARHVALSTLPAVRASTEVEAPLVSGLRRPIVLVPHALPADDLRLAVCHEFMHVRRHDLALGWVPALAERLFFFHPLARLAAREYLTSREAACDAAVVRALGVPPDEYARLLVRMGLARSAPAFAGGAPSSLSSLRRRLDMLHHARFTCVSKRLTWLMAIGALLLLVPFDLTARTGSAQSAPAAAAVPQAPVPAAPATPNEPAPELTAEQREEIGARARDAEEAIRRAIEEQGRAPDSRADALTPEQREQYEQQTRQYQEELVRLMDSHERARRAQRDGLTPEQRERYARQIREYQEQVLRAVESYERARAQERLNEPRLNEEFLEALARQSRAQVQVEDRARERQAENTLNELVQLLRAQQDDLRAQSDKIREQLALIRQHQEQLAEQQRELAAQTERLREALKGK